MAKSCHVRAAQSARLGGAKRARVLWKAEDDPVEHEAVDGGEDGRVGAETGHNNEPALIVVNNGMHESGELTRR